MVPAFVETNHHEYKYTADSMRETLQNYRVIYQPIADALIQVTSGDFADQQKLTK